MTLKYQIQERNEIPLLSNFLREFLQKKNKTRGHNLCGNCKLTLYFLENPSQVTQRDLMTQLMTFCKMLYGCRQVLASRVPHTYPPWFYASRELLKGLNPSTSQAILRRSYRHLIVMRLYYYAVALDKNFLSDLILINTT